MRNSFIYIALFIMLLTGAFTLPDSIAAKAEPSSSGEVNVYSSRKEELVRGLFDEFTRSTGIKVNFITDEPTKLIARMKYEEANSPADLFLTSDVANLDMAKNEGLLFPLKSEILEKNIPEDFRDKQGYWYGLSVRARVLVYAKDRVNKSELYSYEDLAQPRWKGKILIRSSSNVYNQSLIASMIYANGVKKTEEWAKGLVANFARKPQGGDTDQIRAVAAGEGDVAIVNSYYLGRLMASNKPQDQEVAAKVGIFFPDQPDIVDASRGIRDKKEYRGTHVNISGGGLTKTAVNKDNAIKLLEFLSSKKAQQIYARTNHEFPVMKDVKRSAITEKWRFVMDKKPLRELYKYHKEALLIADRVGWR